MNRFITGKTIRDAQKGFTLIEIAIVLVVVGLLVGMGASLIGPMSRQVKHTETKKVLKGAEAALIGHAVTSDFLAGWGDNTPDATTDEFCEVVGKKEDAWAKDLRYRYDARLAVAGDVCSLTGSRITVVPLVGNTVNDVAFVIVSGGEDYTVQTTNVNSGPANGNVTVTQRGDDLITYISLYDLQMNLECSKYDRFKNTGVQVLNSSAVGIYYNRYRAGSGWSGCTQWPRTGGNRFQTIMPGDVYIGYVDLACCNTNCVTQTNLTYRQQIDEVDLNRDRLTSLFYFPASGAYSMSDR